MAVSSLLSTSFRVSVAATVICRLVTAPVVLSFTPTVTVPAVNVAPQPAEAIVGPVAAVFASTLAEFRGLITPEVAPSQLEGVASVRTLIVLVPVTAPSAALTVATEESEEPPERRVYSVASPRAVALV